MDYQLHCLFSESFASYGFYIRRYYWRLYLLEQLSLQIKSNQTFIAKLRMLNLSYQFFLRFQQALEHHYVVWFCVCVHSFKTWFFGPPSVFFGLLINWLKSSFAFKHSLSPIILHPVARPLKTVSPGINFVCDFFAAVTLFVWLLRIISIFSSTNSYCVVTFDEQNTIMLLLLFYVNIVSEVVRSNDVALVLTVWPGTERHYYISCLHLLNSFHFITFLF